MNFIFGCEIGCGVIEVVEVELCYGGFYFFIVIGVLIVEVLFGNVVFVKSGVGFFFKFKVLSVSWCCFKLGDSFVIIIVVYVD